MAKKRNSAHPVCNSTMLTSSAAFLSSSSKSDTDDRHLQKAIDWLCISVSYNPTSETLNSPFKIAQDRKNPLMSGRVQHQPSCSNPSLPCLNSSSCYEKRLSACPRGPHVVSLWDGGSGWLQEDSADLKYSITWNRNNKKLLTSKLSVQSLKELNSLCMKRELYNSSPSSLGHKPINHPS